MKKQFAVTLFVLIIAASSVRAADGDLDITFGTGGKVTTDFDYSFFALHSDGKIVVAGRNQNRLQLARYNIDGSLDAAFGSEGKVTPQFSGLRLWTQPTGIAVQPDEKIVVLSTFSPSYAIFEYSIARYNSDGSLDTTFGIEGTVTVKDRYASSLRIQVDGRIVVAGSDSASRRQLLERYTIDGSPDANFGAGGKIETDVFWGRVAIQADGKILLAGAVLTSGRGVVALARYTSDGSLDTDFGSGGKVITTFPNPWPAMATAVATQSDGKIVVAGGGLDVESGLRFARYNSDGSLDTTFGVEGKVSDDVDATSLAIQSDGKIIVGAGVYVAGLSLTRYDADASLDRSFGNGAYAPGDGVIALALQFDGKIVATAPYSLIRYNNSIPLVRFDRATVPLAGSFKATFSGREMTDDTYFDIRFRYPGSDTDHVTLNWQRGLSAEHGVPTSTMTGTWGITGVRPHLNASDHTSDFLFVSTDLRVE